MPDTWTCSQCQTVNHRHSGRCMACSSKQATSPAADSPDLPATAVRVSDAPARPAPALARTAPTSTSPVSTGSGPSPYAPPVSSTTSSRPARVGPSPARLFATGKLLAIGHIGLFVVALLQGISYFSWGRSALTWAYHQSVANDVAGWSNNAVIRDSYQWLAHLPANNSTPFYIGLAIACLLMRLIRAIPGWISLPIGLVAAAYGALTAISELPGLAIYWPLALGALILSWILVGKTIR